jgi:hypothetical protein
MDIVWRQKIRKFNDDDNHGHHYHDRAPGSIASRYLGIFSSRIEKLRNTSNKIALQWCIIVPEIVRHGYTHERDVMKDMRRFGLNGGSESTHGEIGSLPGLCM